MCKTHGYGRRGRREQHGDAQGEKRRRGRSFWDSFVFDWDIGRGPRRRGRRGMFGKGDLKFVILRLLADRPMHGYDVMKALEEECGGWYKASPGSVYPTLQMLQDQGMLSVEEKDGKKTYSITPEGEAYLDENEEHVEHIFARFGTFTDEFKDDMTEMSQSFARLAKETFESATRWTEDSGFFDEMRSILDDAQEKVREAKARARDAARAARDERRKARSEAGDAGEAASDSDDATEESE